MKTEPVDNCAQVPDVVTGAKNQAHDLSADAAAQARSKHFSDLAKRPRKPRRFSPSVGKNAPPWLKQVMAEVDSMARHPHQFRAREGLEGELRAAGLAPASDLIDLTATAKVRVDMVRAVLLAMKGGVVNRGKRTLYRISSELDECIAAYLSLRTRLGLDAQYVEGTETSMAAAFAASFRDAASKGPRHHCESYATNAAYAESLRGNLARMARDLEIVERRDPTAKPTPPSADELPVVVTPALPAPDLASIDARSQPEPPPGPEVLPRDEPHRPSRDVTPARVMHRDVGGIDPEFDAFYERLGTNPAFER